METFKFTRFCELFYILNWTKHNFAAKSLSLSRTLKWHIIMRQLGHYYDGSLGHYYPLCQESPLLPLHCLVLVVRPGDRVWPVGR